jgi:hypothetical protein
MAKQTHCYICKMGWFEPEEPIPILYNREGIYLCKPCLDITNSRASKMEIKKTDEKAT